MRDDERVPRMDRRGASPAPSERLGVYVDTVVDADAGGVVLTTAESLAFLLFVREVGTRFADVVLFARRTADGPARFPVGDGLGVAALPHYPRLSVAAALRAAPATGRAMWRELSRVDHVWVFGPHPLGLLLVALARVRGRRVTLGVRQDSAAYFAGRIGSRPGRRPVLLALRALDAAWAALARRLPATVVGASVEQRYGGPRPGLLRMTVSLVREDRVAGTRAERPWDAPVELLTVGRIEPEKRPFVLVEAVRILEDRSPGRYRLTWVGEGRMRPDVEARVRASGLTDRVRLAGFVPMGDALLETYRRADAFVHVAVTEAMGQVLVEAQAMGLPVVATDVGGVAHVLDGGAAGVLVAPDDPVALADAIERLDGEPVLRRRIAERGLALARGRTLESTSAAVADFLAGPGRPA
jgi:glycosyltransferase involved in cell wall biosynthesis